MRTPPLIVTNGFGRCVACERNIRDGEKHSDECPIEAAAIEAARPPEVYVVDRAEIARQLVNEINAQRELAGRMELDRIASGTPRARRKRAKAGGAS